MDPATLISGGATLLGGLLGRNKKASPFDTFDHTKHGVIGQASGARAGSARYGFNPLTLLGVSSPMMAAGVDNSAFGQSIANAGLAVADGINAASAQRAYLEKLEEQNKDLRKALDGQTLRPKVGGIFGPPKAGVAGTVAVATPATPGAYGEILEMDKFGFPVFQRGNYSDRPMEIAPEVSEPASKTVRFMDHDLLVWNDEASENELMATASSATLPFQYLWAETKKNAAVRRQQRLDGALQEPSLTIGYNKGDKRPPVEKRVDLRNWPHDGWDPFGPAYRVGQ